MQRQFPCPTCGRPTEWSETLPCRPFCSERCRLIDWGAWISEERRIPGEAAGEAEEEHGAQGGQPQGGGDGPDH